MRRNQLKWRLEASFDEKFNGNIIISFENRLRNNTSKECVVVRKKGSKIAPVVLFDTIVDMYNSCSSIDDIIDYLVRLTTDELPVNMNDLDFTKDGLQKNLRLMLLSKGHNEELLTKIPHVVIPNTDLVVILKYDCGSPYAISVTNDLALRIPDITISEMFEFAFENLNTQEIIFQSLAEVIDEPECDDIPLYVLQCENMSIGAAIILKPRCLDYVRDAIGDFYILPSSVCEVIVLPKYFSRDVSELIRIVREINDETVRPEDQLSDNIYEYDGELRMVEVDVYE